MAMARGGGGCSLVEDEQGSRVGHLEGAIDPGDVAEAVWAR